MENAALKLIIIDDSLNEAESIVSLLKNAGIAVHMEFVNDLDELTEILKPQSHDLIFCNIISMDPMLSQVVKTANGIDPDVHIIATHNEEDQELRTEALTTGARDLISKDDPIHFQLVTKREIGSVSIKRSFKTCITSLHEAEKRCHIMLDSSRDAITYIHEGMHLYANKVYLDTFGFSNPEEIEGTPIMDMVIEADHEQLKKYIRMYSKGEHRTRALDVTGLRPNGKIFRAQMEFSPASIEGESCTQIIIKDQSFNVELEKKLKFLSKKDANTGLYSRPYFMEMLENAILKASQDGKSRSLLYIMPDNSKFIKETLGINGVDTILRDIADILRDMMNKDAIIARFSDIGFTILSEIEDTNELMSIADKIRTTIESHISEIDDKSITFTCSIGASQFNGMESDANKVISYADLACDIAHEKKGNCVHLHNPIADEQASREREIHWSKLIEHALNHDLFSLVYQPIVNLHGDTTEKYEVLLRMTDEENNPIPPSKFFPAAAEHGMSIAIDRWVIVNAIKVLRKRNRTGKKTLLFIKLSKESIADEKILAWILEVIKKAKVSPESLVFEAHEHNVNGAIRQAKQLIDGLRSFKCGFCLEHFGTSENSIQILKHLNVSFIKIDGSFMRNLGSNEKNQAMVKSMTQLADSINAATIAEFVEDASSLAVLWQCGIKYIQGNFLQQPQDIMGYDFEGEEDDEED